MQSFSHFVQWIPLFGGFELHRNCVMPLARFSHISSGSKKLDITYVGRANNINLIRTSFSLFDSHLHVHPFTLFINLSLRKANILHLEPVISYGIPKYVHIPPSFWIRSVSLFCCPISRPTLLAKSNEDFSQLIYWSDGCPYFLTTFINSSHSRSSALQKKMLSSVKRKWDIEGQARVTRIPVIFPWFSAWLRRLTSASVHRIKMKGDKWSHLRRPLSGIMFPLGWPFISTLYLTDVMQHIIHSFQVSEKPIFLVTASMNDHSILSYALLMSVLMAILLFRPLGSSGVHGTSPEQS